MLVRTREIKEVESICRFGDYRDEKDGVDRLEGEDEWFVLCKDDRILCLWIGMC